MVVRVKSKRMAIYLRSKRWRGKAVEIDYRQIMPLTNHSHLAIVFRISHRQLLLLLG